MLWDIRIQKSHLVGRRAYLEGIPSKGCLQIHSPRPTPNEFMMNTPQGRASYEQKYRDESWSHVDFVPANQI